MMHAATLSTAPHRIVDMPVEFLLLAGRRHQGREFIAIVALENCAFCTVFSENFHKF
jgi:hypothetical protein